MSAAQCSGCVGLALHEQHHHMHGTAHGSLQHLQASLVQLELVPVLRRHQSLRACVVVEPQHMRMADDVVQHPPAGGAHRLHSSKAGLVWDCKETARR